MKVVLLKGWGYWDDSTGTAVFVRAMEDRPGVVLGDAGPGKLRLQLLDGRRVRVDVRGVKES